MPQAPTLPSLARPAKLGPAVLILMAIRDGAPWLTPQLASIAAQDMTDWQLWASDDGSTDASAAILADWGARHPGRLHLVKGPGQGSAANFLSLLARPDLPLGPGTHVAFADQDDIWYPHKLSRALEQIAAARTTAPPCPTVYGAAARVVDAAGRDLGRVVNVPRTPGAIPLTRALTENGVGGHAMVLDPEAVALARRAGIPPGLGFHDWWLYLLLTAAGGRVLRDPQVVLDYRQHGGNAQGAWGGASGRARRTRQLLDGTWRSWFEANLAGLSGAAADLTPEAQRIVAALCHADAPHCGPGRLRLHGRLALHRGSPAETALLRLATLFGMA